RDVEPSWTPDGRYVVFSSDRDGISNLYAVRVEDRALLRVSRVLGGAFRPSVSPDGRSVAFESYSSRGYDLHATDVDWTTLEPAYAFVDGYAAPRQAPEPSAVESRPYRPLPAALPRFWTPYAARQAGEWQLGAVTAGSDPLFRHIYALQAYGGTTTRRGSAQA